MRHFLLFIIITILCLFVFAQQKSLFFRDTQSPSGNILQSSVMKAVEKKLLTEKDIDSALAPIFRTQVNPGLFDEKGLAVYANYNADSIANNYHTALARTMAQQSMVLLKNNYNILPLDKSKYNAYMVVGPNASSLDALPGSYHGVSNNTVDFIEGITNAVDAGTRVEYDMGCDCKDTAHFGGIWAAGNADVIIAVPGLTPVQEGEEGDAFLAEGGGDRKNLSLPASHIAYLKALRKGTKTPLIVVTTTGSAIDIMAIEPYADAIVLHGILVSKVVTRLQIFCLEKFLLQAICLLPFITHLVICLLTMTML